jgi:NAD-dependent dihydropyrimidine dehydrogenase PreA subunit
MLGYTATDIAGVAKREGMTAILTSLFPIEQMTAAEHEREDALREGVDIKGGVMPLEVLLDGTGKARALKLCECEMQGMKPVPKEGTEFELECDIIISAIGQSGDLSGLEQLDGGNSFIATDPLFKVKNQEKHFAGGDIVRPHLLTTAIGHGRIAADSIDHFLKGAPLNKRPKVDVHHFNLLQELQQRHLEPEHYETAQVRGTSDSNFAVHNYEDRSATQIISHDELFKGHFTYVAREQRQYVQIEGDAVLGNFEERTRGLTEEQAIREGARCMCCGLCMECNNCVNYCPQDAVHKVKKSEKAIGRYVYTDYDACIGCHICMDVCPSGYIKMGLGE